MTGGDCAVHSNHFRKSHLSDSESLSTLADTKPVLIETMLLNGRALPGPTKLLYRGNILKCV